MSTPERTGSKEFQLGVKQYKAALRFLTDIEDEMRVRKIKKINLAERLGTTRAWVSKLFVKKPNLTIFTAVALADALDMNVEMRAVTRASRGIRAGPVQADHLVLEGFVAAKRPSESFTIPGRSQMKTLDRVELQPGRGSASPPLHLPQAA